MYHDFYQLKENPFNVTTDPDFFFPSKIHQEAISNLQYGIEQRKGILVITGEIGTGKTTLCRKLLKHIHPNVKFSLILNPKFSDLQLMQMIIQDLGIQSKQQNKFALSQALNEYLLRETQLNNNIVVVIDEAQNLTVNQLEQIRLLSNIETEKEKLLQIVLIGQPELYQKLQLPELRQLRQRITVHFHLQALAKQDIAAYIKHRLNKAHLAASATIQFTEDAIDLIYQYTQGTPRTINILCDRALLAAFINESFLINASLIETCAREVLNW